MQLEDVRENIEYLDYVLCHLFRSPALTVNWLNPCDWQELEVEVEIGFIVGELGKAS